MIAFLRDLLIRDFWLKLFALVLAVLIWLTVSFAIRKGETSPADAMANANAERLSLQVPVLVMSTAADVRSFKVSPDKVEVIVSGDPKVLEKLDSTQIRALVDLTDIESARSLRKRIKVTIPPGVTYVSVNPEEVSIIVPPKR